MNKNQENLNKDNKTAIPNTPLRFLWYVTKPYKWYAIAGWLIVILVASLDTLSILFVKYVIRAAENQNFDLVLILGVTYPVVSFLIQSLWRVTGLFGRLWAVGAQKEANNSLFKYTTDHSYTYFVNRFAGSLMSKITNITGAVERLIVDIMWHHTERLVSFVIGSVMISVVDLQSGLTFVALVICLVVVNYFLIPRKQRYSLALAESRTRLRGRIVDVFSNMSATRQYSRSTNEISEMNIYTKDARDRQSISWLYTEYMLFINTVILAFFSVIIFLLLSSRWIDNDIDTASFVTVMVLMFNLSGSLIFIGRAFNDTATSYGEAAEGLSELVVPHEIVDTKSSVSLGVSEAQIDFKDITFKYEENTVFNDFNLTITPGQRVGLVGPSGAGKTTFVSLLLRQHDINSGVIEIDGQNIAEVTQDSLREAIAVVPQEPALFHRTIRENIAYGKPDASLEEIIEVAKKAQAHAFISALPDGYNTMVGERGVKLSGGQKQRVAIARAMLKDAPILVLDEATSALDSESEVEIQKALHILMAGKTVIAIAHRLSTLREMDRIIVLEAGKIVEDGTHETLKNFGGTYQRLWEHQAGGFVGE